MSESKSNFSDKSGILLLGDIFIDHRLVQQILSERKTLFSESALNFLSNYQWKFANLECALTETPDPIKHKIPLISIPEMIDTIPEVNGYCLSNNHIKDSGLEGVKSTIQILQDKDKLFWGFGTTLQEARNPAMISCQDYKISILSYSCLTTNGENYAFLDTPGVAPLAVEYIIEDINKQKEHTDFTIVSLHWGEENHPYPTPDQIAVAHKIIDAGADLIWGHHPHIIQPIEIYKGKQICYSLGNLVFSNINLNSDYGEIPGNNGIMQKRHNQESLGIGIQIDQENNTLKIDKLFGLIFNLTDTIDMINPDMLSINWSNINNNLSNYVIKNQKLINSFNNPSMMIKFNGKIFQNRYTHQPIFLADSQNKISLYTLAQKIYQFVRKIISEIYHLIKD